MRFQIVPIFRTVAARTRVLLLNSVGMACGLSVSMILGSFVVNQYSYDMFHSNAENIFQLWANVQMGENIIHFDRFSLRTGEEISEKLTQVSSTVRMARAGKARLGYLESQFEEANILYSENSLFEVFTFPIVSGGYRLLEQPRTVVISELMGKKYFGNESPIDKTLTYNDTLILNVVGVFKDIPKASSLKFDFVVSLTTLKSFKNFRREFQNQTFGLGSIKTYVKLNKSSGLTFIEENLPKGSADFKILDFHLEKLAGAHVRNYGGKQELRVHVYLVIAAILFCLVLLNSMNLTAALSIERTREIMIRKINGASRMSIIQQFYIEACLQVFFSLLFSIGLASVFVGFSELTFGVSIDRNFLFSSPFIFYLPGAFFVMVLAGGAYPAIVLSSKRPIFILANKSGNSLIVNGARTFLVGIQFTAAVILIVSSLLMADQIHSLKRTDLGIDIADVLVFNLSRDDAKKYVQIRQKLSEINGITAVGASNAFFYDEFVMTAMGERLDSAGPQAISLMVADTEFLEVLRIKKLSGEYSKKGIILNETASGNFFPHNDPIGAEIKIAGRPNPVVAVVKDFNFASLRDRISNLGFTIADDSAKIFGFTGCNVYVRISNKADQSHVIPLVASVYQSLHSKNPFGYSMLQDKFDKDIAQEMSILRSLRFFMGVAILVAVFGLGSLFAYQAAKEMPELSIRRVLGASPFQVSRVFIQETTIIIIISVLVGVPIAVYLVEGFFHEFVIKQGMEPRSIVLGILIVVALAAAIVLGVVIRVATTSPVRFLRNE